MKILFINLLTSFFVLTANFTNAQKMVQTVSDISKLKENEKQFIGKPLKVILKQIKPKLKMFYGNLINNPEVNTYIVFRFVDRKTFDRYPINKPPTTLRIIFVKNSKNKSFQTPMTRERIWTRADEKEFGDWTVGDILVSGEN